MKKFPDLILLETRVTLTLQSTDGRRAWYDAKSRARILRLLKERRIQHASDGEVKIETVSPGKVIEETRVIGGHSARIEFDPPLQPDSLIEMETAVSYVDSFALPHEYFIIPVVYPIEHFYCEVIFPPESEIIESTVSSVRRGKVTKESPPTIKQDKTGRYRIAWEKKKLPMGSEYRIEWTWHPKSSFATSGREGV